MRRRSGVCIASWWLVLAPTASFGQWAVNGAEVSTESGLQGVSLAMAPDGGNGAIIVWTDTRDGNFDIYAQRIDVDGFTLWAVDGVPICTAEGTQDFPVIVRSSIATWIIAWQDDRSLAGDDIYAQKVNGLGAPLWAADGVFVASFLGDDVKAVIVPDGAGGAIVAHANYFFNVSRVGIQRIDQDGVIQWGFDPVGVLDEDNPALVTDGAGGAIVSWQDFRGASHDVYAQRYGSTGAAQWTGGGVQVTDDPDEQRLPVAAPDGSGGVLLAWLDTRLTGSVSNIFAQRLSANGSLQWASNGVPVCTASGGQDGLKMAPVGGGAAIVTWTDYRSVFETDVFVQRITGSGVAEWTADGVGVCVAPGSQLGPLIVPDLLGGAIIAWADLRNDMTEADVFAQRVDASGAPYWTANGLPVCTSPGYEGFGAMVSDDVQGAIISWGDERTDELDVYAQRFDDQATRVAPPAARESFIVRGSYPNPMSRSSQFEIELTQPANVSIDIYDVHGRSVDRIESGELGAGVHVVTIDAIDGARATLPSGIYLCRIRAGAASVTRKIVIAK